MAWGPVHQADGVIITGTLANRPADPQNTDLAFGDSVTFAPRPRYRSLTLLPVQQQDRSETTLGFRARRLLNQRGEPAPRRMRLTLSASLQR